MRVFFEENTYAILENAMDKWKVKCNLKLRPNYFSVNVFVLAVVFCLQISKNWRFCQNLISDFLQTLVFFETFNHIFRTYNQINYRNIWFPKVILIFIRMSQAFFNVFSKKTRSLMSLRRVMRHLRDICWADLQISETSPVRLINGNSSKTSLRSLSSSQRHL